jgi:hypothetical protein
MSAPTFAGVRGTQTDSDLAVVPYSLQTYFGQGRIAFANS